MLKPGLVVRSLSKKDRRNSGLKLKNEVKKDSKANQSDAIFPSLWPNSALPTSVLLQVAGFLSSHIFQVVFSFCFRQECVSWQNKAR